jgi:L-aspartate N-monooxygenase (nitrosuccinate-forming)
VDDDIGGGTAICVVGMGPRGLSVVERVCANAMADGTPVRLHVVDPHLRRGGRVWHTDQPGVLLMNTVASQVTMFTDASVACAGPVRTGPSLYEWATSFVPTEPFGPYPDWVYAEAAALGPDSYPTRAFYGHYLRWVFATLTRCAPDVVAIEPHGVTAVGLVDETDGTQTVTLSDGRVLTGLDAVVLALGHVDVPLTGEERALADFADAHGLRYVPPGNPAETDLAAIGPGEHVALRGLGLNFFDHMALLTVGRGGRFTEAGDGLVYEPSGREPLLVAGSRRGVPYHARGENQKGVDGRHLPLFLTPEVIADLRRRGGIGFTTDVWPLVDREVRAVFYRAQAEDPAGFLTAFRAAPDDPDLPARFGITERWDWDRIARPHGQRRFAGHDEFQAWLLDHLRRDLAEARLGNVSGPLKAALDVMRDIRNEIRLVVDHGGLTGGSYRDELMSWYTPLNAFVSIGPPPRRIAEMVALVEAGVLRVCGPGMQVKAAPSGFVVRSEEIPGAEFVASTLIEARLPVLDLRATTDPLLSGLVAAGACSTYRIPDQESGDFVSGGLAVTPKPYRMIDASGRVHPRRFAFGVPTEPVHWGTAAGIRPGVDSVILGDADAIARACLSMADRREKVDG